MSAPVTGHVRIGITDAWGAHESVPPDILRRVAEDTYAAWLAHREQWPPERVAGLHPELRAALRWLATTGGVW